jgi:hypothetical protein
MTKVEFFLVINSDGDVELGTDRDETIGNSIDNYGQMVVRVIKFNAEVSLPEDEEVDVTVPETAGEKTTATTA